MPAYEALAGVTAAIDWLASLAPADAGSRPEHLETTFRALHERGEQLVGQLWEGLTRITRRAPFRPASGQAADAHGCLYRRVNVIRRSGWTARG